MSSMSDDRQKWALLIGIDRYPNFRPLKGCVNDVLVMSQILTDNFGFPQDHVTVLTDEAATRHAMWEAMTALVGKVGQDDIVVFHYSGHGSRMPSAVDSNDPDGKDETIVPFDSGRAPHDNRDIRDDEIYFWVKSLTSKTSAVTLIFDCCHSGTIVRDEFGEEARWAEPEVRPREELPSSPIPLSARALVDGDRNVGPSGWLPLGERYVLIAGCERSEQSYEVQVQAGARHGALTYFLVQELKEARTGTTYRDVFEGLAPGVTSLYPNQHPQLEGALDLEVFGVRRIEPMRFVPIVSRSKDKVVLGAGAACGLTEGSQWAVYPSGTKTIDDGERPLGIVSLSNVKAVTSEGILLRESRPDAVKERMRAVEQSRPVDAKMPVEVVPLAKHALDIQALMDGLERSQLVRPARHREDAKARVYLLPPEQKARKSAPAPMLESLPDETWAVVGENGELLMPPHRRNEPGVVGLLLDNLEKTARYRLTLELENEGSGLAGKVEAELFRWTGTEMVKPEVGPDGRPVFYEEDQMAIRLVHHHDTPLFVYILDMGLTGRINLIYPVRGAEDAIEPHRPIDVGTREGEELDLYFPEEFPFVPSASGGPVLEGFETLKIFATTHPADFLPLLQRGVREAPPSVPVSSLSGLLAATFGGGGYRDAGMRSPSLGPQDWTAFKRSFRLRRQIPASLAAGGRSF